MKKLKTHSMNRSSSRFASRVTRFAILCLFSLPLYAQEEKPEVRVSMYFAEETSACRPDGYRGQDDGLGSRCEEWTFEDLDDMVRRNDLIRVQHGIPPEELRLNEDLLDSIDAYTDVCSVASPCLDASGRYAIILAFEVDVVDDGDRTISIRRVLPSGSPFGSYSSGGQLSERGRWIDHQRADIFLPSYSVRWQLEIGPWRWDLGTRVQ